MTKPKNPNRQSSAGLDNVIPLSRYRAQTERELRVSRVEDLASAPDAKAQIQALPPDDLYHLVRRIGLDNAQGILAFATPEQIQVALDFDAWDGDRLTAQRCARWLEAMAQAPAAKIGEWLTGIDSEMVGLLLRTNARIYDLTQEEPPEEPEGTFWPSPDRLFVLDILPPRERRSQAPDQPDGPPPFLRIIDSLYRYDRDFARRILVGARAELDSELEEAALRWRAGRMADMGFADFYESLEVYRPLDPSTVRIGEIKPGSLRVRPLDSATAGKPSRPPMALVERLSVPGSPFADAIAGIHSREEQAELQFALVALTNRVLSADRVQLADDEAAREVIERLAATLDLALEFLARGDQATAAEQQVMALRTVPLVRLFRVGASLTGKVRELANALRQRGPFAVLRPRIELFEADDLAVLEAVGRIRPVFPRIIDHPPMDGTRPFRSLADLARATAALEQIGAAMALLVSLGVRPEHLSDENLGAFAGGDTAAIDAAVVARTVLVGRLLGRSAGPLQLLAPAEIAEFKTNIKKGKERPELNAKTRAHALALLKEAVPPGIGLHAAGSVALRWVDSLAPLEPVLIAGPPVSPVRPKRSPRRRTTTNRRPRKK